MNEYDHEYALTVRPNANLRVAYSTDDGTIERGFLAVEYGRNSIDPDNEGEEGIEWRGYEIALARDGENVLDRGIGRLLDRDVPLLDRQDVERGVEAASGYGRKAKERLGKLRERRRGSMLDAPAVSEAVETPETVEVPGPGETTVEISLSGAAATFELYEDGGENWRWRLTHEDGDTLAVSATGYDSREDAEETITALKSHALGARIER